MIMMKVQEISVGDVKAVVVPLDTWHRLMDLLEDIEDERLFDEATSSDDKGTINHGELCRQLGRSPLRYLRQKAGLTQVQLSKKTGLSQSFITRLEAGKKRMSDSSRKKLARSLGVSPEDLEF